MQTPKAEVLKARATQIIQADRGAVRLKPTTAAQERWQAEIFAADLIEKPGKPWSREKARQLHAAIVKLMESKEGPIYVTAEFVTGIQRVQRELPVCLCHCEIAGDYVFYCPLPLDMVIHIAVTLKLLYGISASIWPEGAGKSVGISNAAREKLREAYAADGIQISDDEADGDLWPECWELTIHRPVPGEISQALLTLMDEVKAKRENQSGEFSMRRMFPQHE